MRPGGTRQIDVMGVALEVVFDYQPEEPAEHYGDAPYPGCPEAYEVCEVILAGVDIHPLLSQKALDSIEEKLREYQP